MDRLTGPVTDGPVVTVVENWTGVDVPTVLVAVTLKIEVPASPAAVARLAVMVPFAFNVAHAGSAPLEIAYEAGVGKPLVAIVRVGKVWPAVSEKLVVEFVITGIELTVSK